MNNILNYKQKLQNEYDLKIFTDNIEYECLDQLQLLLQQDMFKDCKIRIMADCHSGKGCVIGFTANLGDKVIPNIVGVDLGCFTGDTKVKLCDNRDVTFKQLVEESEQGIEHYGYCLTKTGEIKIDKLEMPRKIKEVDVLIQITLDNGQTIKCTEDHIFYTRYFSEVRADELKIGDSLCPLYINKLSDIDKNKLDHEYKDKFLKDMKNHLCIYQPNTNKYQFIHILADDYNIENNVYTPNKEESVRHHKDFVKTNNNPTNIQRVTYKQHFNIHSDNVSLTNKLGITGWGRVNQIHPRFM